MSTGHIFVDDPTPQAIRHRALRMLARREQCRKDLLRKLSSWYPEDRITPILDALEKEGWLSDARYARLYAQSRSSRYGGAYLCAALKAKNIPPAAIESALQSLDIPEDTLRAQELWDKRFAGMPPALRDEKFRARCMRFFLHRGFSADIVYRLLEKPSP